VYVFVNTKFRPLMKKKITDIVTSIELEIDYSSQSSGEIESVRQALLPETNYKDTCNLSVTSCFNRRSRHLRLEFISKDIVALRASMNTNLRLMASSIETLRELNFGQ
jgi:tRNA threonylcarbamoyladenosine modification (KEOPS) complex  Pcc1 subunit